ncbi:hypothetical protein ACXEO8_03930 [Cytobacillus firmus]
MDFAADVFWLVFVILSLCLFLFVVIKQHKIKKEQEYIIKLNHEILDRLRDPK